MLFSRSPRTALPYLPRPHRQYVQDFYVVQLVMNGSVEATRAMQMNLACTKVVKEMVPLPKDLQGMLLTFVGVFQKYNQLDHAFHDINGSIDFEAGTFQCYNGWRPFAGAVNFELSEEVRDTVVFVDDVFCFNPFHIWSEQNEKLIREFATDKVCELTGPHLTVGEILDFMLKCELEHRPNTLWFGGPDHAHIYFEHFEVADFDEVSQYTRHAATYFPQADYTIVWRVFWGS